MNTYNEQGLIFKCYSGSISYGTNTPESDTDYRGVCIPSKEQLLGLNEFEQYERKEPDEVIFSLKKFVRLALNNNPNVIDTLFVNEKHITHINEYGHELRSIRDHFLSVQIYKTYGGYAISQLKRMTTIEKNATGKRAVSIEKYGYDTKNALHLIRLLNMGIEILNGAGVQVYRPDRDYLNEIRYGQYTLQQIEREYQRLVDKLDEAYINSKLPEAPNVDLIRKWLVDVQLRSLKNEN